MKFLFKNLVRKILSYLNIYAHRSVTKEKLISFIKLFKIKIPEKFSLIRVGSEADGGYLIPNIMSQIDYCFSAGIGSNIQFEKDLLKYDIKSFGADNSVNKLPSEVRHYSFLKKNISSVNDQNNITFENWVNDYRLNDNLIGQIDIEGGEYNLILNTPNHIFKKFKIIIFEFHNVQKISDSITYEFYFNALKKLLENFNICHVHINNAEKFTKIRNIEIPHLLEVTFLRKDFYKGDLKKIELPHHLDRKNVPSKTEIKFDNNWLDYIA